MFGQITNPPASRSVTVNNGELANLTGGLQVSAPPGLTIFEYDAKMPTSVQWNTGLQFNLPWASVMDVEYVGNHSSNLLEQTDIKRPTSARPTCRRTRTRRSRRTRSRARMRCRRTSTGRTVDTAPSTGG